MRLIMNAGHEHVVYSKLVRAGEEFETPDSEAVVWIHSGRAHEAPHRNSTIATRSLQAAHERPPEEQKQTKRYTRRDMRAEEE